MLHRCRDAPPLDEWLEHDAGCMQKIFKVYGTHPVVPLGEGVTGAVFELRERAHPTVVVAVKCIPYRSRPSLTTNAEAQVSIATAAQMELGIACEVNRLKKLTPAFVRTFGYLVCSTIPDEWRERLPVQHASGMTPLSLRTDFDRYLLMFMERPEFEFDTINNGGRYKIPMEKYGISLFYILLHAIYLMRKYLRMAHGDFAPRNLMFSTYMLEEGEEARPLKLFYKELDVGAKVEFHAGLLPKIIDFGHSWSAKNPRNLAYTNNDIHMLWVTLGSRRDIRESAWYQEMQRRPPRQWTALLRSEPHEWEIVQNFLLEARLFEETPLIQKLVRKPQPIECTFCHQPARVTFENKQIHACSTFCASKVEGMSALLPE